MKLPKMRGCDSTEWASSGRNSREEVSVGSAAASAAKSEHHSTASLARRAKPNQFSGVLAVARGAVRLLTGASAGFPHELQEAAGVRDQGLARGSCAWKPATGASSWIRGRRRSQAGWTTTMGGGASGKQFAPIWSRFLASAPFTVRRPCVCRFDSAGCADLIAVFRRFGHAYRNSGRRALQCSCSPAGRFRARRHGSVARPTPTSPAARADARQGRRSVGAPWPESGGSAG